MNAPTHATKPAMSAEKKKLMVLAGLGLFGLLLWGRVLIQRVPRTVVAEPAAAQAAPADPSPAGGSDSAPAPAANEPRKTVNVDLPQKLPRDLFALDPSRYAQVVKEETDIRPPGKSEPQASDVSPRVTAGSSGLVLQATILGEHPCAVINGQVLRPGQKIKGFGLRKVLPQRVVMEMNGNEFTLTK